MAAKVGSSEITQNSTFGNLNFNSCILMLIVVVKCGLQGLLRVYDFAEDIVNNAQQSKMTEMKNGRQCWYFGIHTEFQFWKYHLQFMHYNVNCDG